MSFGSDLVGCFEIFDRMIQPKKDLAWQRWATRSLFHIIIPLFDHIWMAWNGSAATDEVLWLQTA
jgi:hypothetical protein